MAKGPEIPKTDSAETEILIERLCVFGDGALGVGIIISGVSGNFSIRSITMSAQSHYSILK
jgi:hypothetical protein